MPGRSLHSFWPCEGPKRPSRNPLPRPAPRAGVAPCGKRSPISRLAPAPALHWETHNKRRYRGVAVNIFHALRDEFDVPAVMRDFRHGAINNFECGDEISVERDSPLAVGIAELSFRIE